MAKGKGTGKAVSKVDALEQRVNVLGQAVFGSENFGKIMSGAVITRSRLRRGFADRMAQGLHLYNLPTQDDVVALGEQCARIEERLARMESMLQSLSGNGATRSGPPRTKKAPKRKSATSAGTTPRK